MSRVIVLDAPGKLSKILVGMNRALGDIPLTVKLRTGVKEGKNTAHKLMPRLAVETFSVFLSGMLFLGERNAVRADPLPARNTRSIGHPQLTSTKSIPPAPCPNSRAIVSTVGTIVAGLLPASWAPKIRSDG
jgi:hypothetical protein